MEIRSKNKNSKTKGQNVLYTAVNPNKGKKLPFMAALLSVSSLFLSGSTVSAETAPVENQYIFNLQSIVTHGGSQLNGTDFLEDLKQSYIGGGVTLVDIKNIQRHVRRFYEGLNIENVQVDMKLPKFGEQELHILITEPASAKKYDETAPLITAINFAGDITAEPEGILDLASTYTDKPYSLVGMLAFQNALKKYYTDTTNLVAEISLPEFNSDTGEVFLEIIEIPKELDDTSTEVAPTEVAPSQVAPIEEIIEEASPSLIDTVLNAEPQKLTEVTRGIFLKQPAPERWKEITTEFLLKKPETPKKTKTIKTKVQKTEPPKPVAVTPTSIGKIKAPLNENEQPETLPAVPSPASNATSMSPFGDEVTGEEPEFTHISDTLTLIDRSDDSLLILELAIDGKLRSEGISAFLDYNSDTLYIPISELSDALSFSLDVTPEEGKISGFFLKNENTFELDMDKQSLQLGGKDVEFPITDLEASHDDVYATAELLQAWFPLKIELKYAEQRLEVTSGEELPYQAYAKRRGIWKEIEENSKIIPNNAPKRILERSLISKPQIYTAVNTSVTRSRDDEVSSQNSINLQATADVLRMAGHLSGNINYNSGEKPKVNDVKATLTKLSPNADLLGGLKATQLELGDVDYQTQPLLSATSSGRGAFISNKNINNVRDPDNFVINGNAPAGWDVEVYQNGLLLDFQTAKDDGTYSFTTIPLQSGLNTFDIKVFGPNGERQDHTENFYLGSNVLKPGTFNYDFIATQSSSKLIPVEDTDADDDGIISLSTEYGLFKNLSVAAGVYTGPTSGTQEDINAYTAGIKTAFLGTDLQTDYITQSNDASAFQFIARKRINKNSTVNLTYRKNKGYTQAENNILETKSLTVNNNFDFSYLPDFQLRTQWENEKLITGTEQDKISTKIGAKLFGVHLTNDLNMTLKEDESSNTYNGTLTASTRLKSADLRGRVNYNVQNDAGLKQINLRANSNIGKGYHLTGSVTQNFDDGPKLATYDGSVRWRLPQVDLGVTLGGDSQGSVRAGLNLSSYFLPSAAGYKFNNSEKAYYGDVQVSVRAFVDENKNHTYDDDEELLEGVTFQYRRRGKIAHTDENGIATLSGLNAFTDNLISIDLLSLDNIYLKPTFPSMNVLGRPYQHGSIDFPLRLEGEASGEVIYHAGGAERALSGITLNLTDENSNIVSTTISEFDGYYMFTGVPMGKLNLVLDQEDLNLLKSKVKIEKPESITLESEDPFIDSIDIHVYAEEISATEVINNSLKEMVNEAIKALPK